ncbi:hypothetical protein [Flavobacterium sp. '19STA2R22 D10 B1']|uniref:hypothetical protein n=1 Tax=Flavobacterium aerium TaxID=3037261 RepID=UPI00278BF99B|nr:hypothetical protein [Flavobacterium sp. '19STA2R22 D10 B1']
MNKKTIIKSISIACFILSSVVTYGQRKIEYLFPTSSTFNEAETSQLLQTGTSSIKGNAFLLKKKKPYYTYKGASIILFPVTPYFSEFMELKKKDKRGKREAAMTNDAFAYRVQGRFLDNQGNFEFTDLMPGKYCIITWIQFEKQKTVSLQTGTSTTYNVYSGNTVSTNPIYSDFTQTYAAEEEVIGYVEITSNGQIINTVISNQK